MAEQAYAYVTLIPVAKGFQGAVAKEMGNVGNVGAKAGEDAGRGFGGGFGKTIAGIAGLVAGAFSVRAITNFAKESILAAEAVSTANARLDAVAKATGVFGDATDEVTGRLQDFAKAQESLIAVDDTVIKGVQAQLLSFKELSTSADEAGGAFDRATIAAFDMAAAGFGSAESNATALGKALEDPIKGVTALSRTGTVFTDEQREQIKVLQESGDLLGAQEIILSELEGQYGGVAEATADASDRMAIAMHNIKEAVGNELLPIFADLVDELMPVMDEVIPVLGEAIQALAPVLKDVAGQIPTLLQALFPLIPIIGEIIGMFFELAAAVLPLVVDLFDALLPVIADLLPVVTSFIYDAMDVLVPILLELINALLPIISTLLPVFMELFEALAPIFMDLIVEMMPLIQQVLPPLISLIETVTPILVILAQILAGVLVTAVTFVINVVQSVIGFFTNFAEAASNLWKRLQSAFKSIMDFFANFWRDTLAAFSRGIDSIVQFFRDLPGKVLNVLRTAGTWLIETGRNIIDGLWNGLKAVWDTVTGWFTSFPSMILGFLGNAGRWLVDVGRQVINGFLDGLKRAWGAVTSWISGAASRVSGAFKRILGISSPSKVFMEFGEAIGEGLVLGMQSMQPEIESQVGMMIQVPNADRSVGRSSPSQTMVYNAAPNQSLSAEQELMKAMRRARLVAQW